MNMKTFTGKLLPVCAAVGLAFSTASHADELVLGALTANPFGFGNITGIGGTINDLLVPSTSNYGFSFSDGESAVLNPLVGAEDYNVALYYFLHFDDALANGSTITINLGKILEINKLHVNVFEGISTPLTPAAAISSVDSVITDPNYTVNVAVLDETFLPGGDYTLQVLANFSGVVGGAFGGTLNLAPAPVPVPAAVWLLGSALTGVVATRRRKDA